ncbi:class I SAM-dependent methyltransferase [Planococcus salinus]|nr:methyltransferase domain-containing protein [Planococcus salinus]
MSTREYVKNLIKDRNIASITPTSKKGVEEICSRMDLSNPVTIIEYGPATGVFTNYLLERITVDSKIIAIELNKNFADYLKKNTKDERLLVHHDHAGNVEQILDFHQAGPADYVISGIPFSLLDASDRDDIIRKTSEVLKPWGKFLPYQTFFQKDEHLKLYLEKYFSVVKDNYFLRNFPPMRVYEAIK